MKLPEGLEHPRDLSRILEALATAGFEPDDLAAFAHGNWLNTLGEQD
jgi:microsomal dipeptidase-like Zn-dependent dipeptidase